MEQALSSPVSVEFASPEKQKQKAESMKKDTKEITDTSIYNPLPIDLSITACGIEINIIHLHYETTNDCILLIKIVTVLTIVFFLVLVVEGTINSNMYTPLMPLTTIGFLLDYRLLCFLLLSIGLIIFLLISLVMRWGPALDNELENEGEVVVTQTCLPPTDWKAVTFPHVPKIYMLSQDTDLDKFERKTLYPESEPQTYTAIASSAKAAQLPSLSAR